MAPGIRSAESGDEIAAARNRRRALTICLAPALVIGIVVGGIVAAAAPVAGVVVFAVVTVALASWAWQRAPRSVLRAVGARPANEDEYPRVHNLVDGLCATMGLPAPAILVVDHPLPNAMAVGNHPRAASLVITSSLERSLSLVELEGVLAHELVHVKRHDTLCSGVAVAIAGPLAAWSGAGPRLVRALVGAGREFAADQRAVGVVRYSAGLASALGGMDGATADVPWPPGGRRAALTRCLWIHPVPDRGGQPALGDLDDAGVRAAALLLR